MSNIRRKNRLQYGDSPRRILGESGSSRSDEFNKGVFHEEAEAQPVLSYVPPHLAEDEDNDYTYSKADHHLP